MYFEIDMTILTCIIVHLSLIFPRKKNILLPIFQDEARTYRIIYINSYNKINLDINNKKGNKLNISIKALSLF